MRFVPSFLLVAAIVVGAASTSQAFAFQVTELSGCESGATTGCIGEEITIGVRVLNDGGADGIADDIAAIAASFFDYSPGVVSFVDGSAVSSLLETTCIPAVGCFQGISNLLGPTLAESSGSVPFFNGVTITTGHTLDGSQNPGLDGVIGGGDAQFRVRFRVVGAGITTIQIGTNPLRGENVISRALGAPLPDVMNAAVVIRSDGAPYVVPEPGTALSIGLGLTLLALRRRSPTRLRR